MVENQALQISRKIDNRIIINSFMSKIVLFIVVLNTAYYVVDTMLDTKQLARFIISCIGYNFYFLGIEVPAKNVE